MQHFYEDVPGLGNVAVSRHAQERALEQSISDRVFEDVLLTGKDTPEGLGVVWREKRGLRLVILLKPEPFRGAKLVKTVYWVKAQGRASR